MGRRSARPFLAFVLSGVMLAVGVWVYGPSRVTASTESSMASTILTLLNHDRVSHGLVALQVDGRIAAVASNRAQWMASNETLSHQSYGGEVWDALAAGGVATYSSGEAIGSTTVHWGTGAASYLYSLWRDSPEHWRLMMSGTYNYLGVGVAYRAPTGETFASLVFAEVRAFKPPVAQITAAGSSQHGVFFSWTGHVVILQTHTAGVRDFDVDYRVDDGRWSTIRSHTTSTRLTLTNRPSGHVYSVRVRVRDSNNNVSNWTAPKPVRVP